MHMETAHTFPYFALGPPTFLFLPWVLPILLSTALTAVFFPLWFAKWKKCASAIRASPDLPPYAGYSQYLALYRKYTNTHYTHIETDALCMCICMCVCMGCIPALCALLLSFGLVFPYFSFQRKGLVVYLPPLPWILIPKNWGIPEADLAGERCLPGRKFPPCSFIDPFTS